MCRHCLIGGMYIKNVSCIFSRHGFTVQEKAKANKAQTQKKKMLLFIYGMGVYTTQNQTQGPRWYRGPCTPWQPSWHHAEVQLQPKTLAGTAQCKIFSVPPTLMPFAHLPNLTWSRGHKVRTPGNFPKHPTNCRASQLLKNCWKHSQKPWFYHRGTQAFSGSQHQRLWSLH